MFRDSQLDYLNKFGQKITGLGFNFAVYDTAGEVVLYFEGGAFASDTDKLCGYSQDVLCRFAESGAMRPELEIEVVIVTLQLGRDQCVVW